VVVFDVSDPSFPKEVGTIPTSGEVTSIQVAEGLIFFTDTNRELMIYEVQNAAQPKLVGQYILDDADWDLCIAGGKAYLVDGKSNLRIIDVASPGKPVEVGRGRTQGDADGIYVQDEYAFVADGGNGLAVFDVSMSNAMHQVRKHDLPGEAKDVFVKGATAYVVGPDGQMWTVNVFDLKPQPLLEAGGYATPNPFLPVCGQNAYFNFKTRDAGVGFVIRIFNLRGRLQRTLTQTREWDGRSESGHLCESGVYVYQIEADGRHASGKVVLIK
jgi:hypothetical protein